MRPRIQLAHLPSPIEPLDRLSSLLNGPRLLVKRDDLTGLAFGGNKTRKLEFLLADAIEKSARTLVTTGAVQSNNCRQTAAAAARAGLDCIIVLAGERPSNPSGNLLIDHLLGAELVWSSRERRDLTLQETFQAAKDTGRSPYLIPYGGSSPTGAVAYAFAMEEMIEQGVQPDWIVFPTSSGGTQAGLVAGAHLHRYQGRILGISIEEPVDVLQQQVANLASETARLLGITHKFKSDEILVSADYLGQGYGVMGKPEREAIHLFARTEGLLLDPVYTGRAAAGLVDLARRKFFRRDQIVLFWHTGGTPALFADAYADLVQKSSNEFIQHSQKR